MKIALYFVREGRVELDDVMLWKELARQVPSLIVLVFLVYQFLKFLKEYQTSETVRTERMAGALEKNTELFGRVLQSIESTRPATEKRL